MGRKWWSGPSLLIAAMVLMPIVSSGVRQVMAQETAALIVNNDACGKPESGSSGGGRGWRRAVAGIEFDGSGRVHGDRHCQWSFRSSIHGFRP